jgi:DNA polymerase IV
MDAFYVSVEIRDNPSLAYKPVAVGGKSDRRGVLSTCNYIARKYGVSSAMPTSVAKQKCPNLIIVPGRMDIYKEVSSQIKEIFELYTDKIEPLSLDEAYLDLTYSSKHKGSATLVAEEIRAEIYRKTKLTASAGIAPLKFLAKIASDQNKPNGQFTIAPEHVMDFIESLELRKIPGVGKVTQSKLTSLGFRTCGDIRKVDKHYLIESLGKLGSILWDRCHGVDQRDVEVSRVRKSVGVERTFEHDMTDKALLVRIIQEKLLPELERRAAPHLKVRKMNKLGVKVKFGDFQQTTKEKRSECINLAVIQNLLDEALERGRGKAVRLLGLHIGLDAPNQHVTQLRFPFD